MQPPSGRVAVLLAVLAAVICPGVGAEYIYPGALYPAGCSVPPAATASGRCPDNLSDPDEPFELPQVNISVNLRKFTAIDQKLFTFTATVELIMVWVDDGRTLLDIQLMTANTSRSNSKCGKPCFVGLAAAQACCDGIWLPTLQLDNAETKTVVQESYAIDSDAYRDSITGNSASFVTYIVRLSATFDQNLDFTAFPFDQHALRVSISCTTCDFAPLTSQLVSYAQGGYIHGSPSTPVRAASFGNTNVTLLANAGRPLSAEDSMSVDGQSYPLSSGWQIRFLELFVVTNTDNRALKTKPIASIAEVRSATVNGVVFVIHTARVTRIYYALQTIVPPIILVLSAFTAFLVAKDRFVDRLKALVGLMFPLYIFQFALTAILPGTYTLLAPNYLVFVSLIILLCLILVSAVSFLIVSRKDRFEWKHMMRKGRENWVKRQSHFRSESVRVRYDSSEVTDETLIRATDLRSDSAHAAANGMSSHQEDNVKKMEEGKKDKDDKKDKDKAHDELVEKAIDKLMHKRRSPIRAVKWWWSAMAFSDIRGYREHVALVFETIALTILMLFYIAAVLVIFLRLDHIGHNVNTS
ncbi:hypothetical protein WJX73_005920 [Symbiochloris irregularis]|uniref:Uncharacterized protein n=1 Tax=Symbiochloris irregularis TaxID=706552 RepID=A0AAW1P0Y8_9CHLO